MPFLIEGALDDPHQILRDLRAYVNRRNGEAVLLGEVNLAPPQVREFLGDEDGDELHMVLDFIGNQALYLVARARRRPSRWRRRCASSRRSRRRPRWAASCATTTS